MRMLCHFFTFFVAIYYYILGFPEFGKLEELKSNDESNDSSHHQFTPPKFNMEPDNQPLEKEIPKGNHHFPAPC